MRTTILAILLASFLTACGGGGAGGGGDVLSVAVLAPDTDIRVGPGGLVAITYEDAGRNRGGGAATDLLADADGDLSTQDDHVSIAVDRPVREGERQSVLWDLTNVPPGTYRIVAVTRRQGTDPVVALAPGTVLLSSVSFLKAIPTSDGSTDFSDIEVLPSGAILAAGSISGVATFGLGEEGEIETGTGGSRLHDLSPSALRPGRHTRIGTALRRCE